MYGLLFGYPQLTKLPVRYLRTTELPLPAPDGRVKCGSFFFNIIEKHFDHSLKKILIGASGFCINKMDDVLDQKYSMCTY